MTKYEVCIADTTNSSTKKSVTIRMKGKYKNNLVFINSILNQDLDIVYSPKSTYRNNLTIVKDDKSENNSVKNCKSPEMVRQDKKKDTRTTNESKEIRENKDLKNHKDYKEIRSPQGNKDLKLQTKNAQPINLNKALKDANKENKSHIINVKEKDIVQSNQKDTKNKTSVNIKSPTQIKDIRVISPTHNKEQKVVLVNKDPDQGYLNTVNTNTGSISNTNTNTNSNGNTQEHKDSAPSQHPKGLVNNPSSATTTSNPSIPIGAFKSKSRNNKTFLQEPKIYQCICTFLTF